MNAANSAPATALVDIHVVEHDDGRLAAELGGHRDERSSGRRRDHAAGLGAAGDVELGEAAMFGERLAGATPKSRNEIHHSWRNARLLQQRDEPTGYRGSRVHWV